MIIKKTTARLRDSAGALVGELGPPSCRVGILGRDPGGRWIQNVELLAEAEHNGWMEHKLRNGWIYGEKREEPRKVHDCLRPYRELSERKNKDRNSVGKFPEIIKEAKFKIMSLSEK